MYRAVGAWVGVVLVFVVGCPAEKAAPIAAATAPAGSTPAAPTKATPPHPVPTDAAAPRLAGSGAGHVSLDGVAVAVKWQDGDTFSWRDPASGKRRRARLAGFNALESYAAVHRWGSWQPAALLRLAKQAQQEATARSWACEDTGRDGGYGRALVRCPGLARHLVAQGLAHVFALDGPADAELLGAQQRAQQAGSGYWAEGVPRGIVTSVHSADEPGRRRAYDRVADTRTGQARAVSHDHIYLPCQWVCHQGSCMAHIPYPLRHGPNRRRCPPPDGGVADGS